MTPASPEPRERWLEQALGHAGIDRGRWRPSRGVDANQATIEAVYTYYGRLFLEHPHLQWAGMANMVGPSFYAGFRDVGTLPDLARRTLGAVVGGGRRSRAEAAGDLGFYETTFLRMQKKIFEDQASMHEAYLTDGLAAIEDLYRAHAIDAATLEGWRQIDRGRQEHDAQLLCSGNRMLLLREQWDIIDRFYASMLEHHGDEGALFTYLMTLAGAPSVPGAHAYAERYPLTFCARALGPTFSLQTPLADGDIAVFASRWMLIESDTLPAYLAFVDERPAAARALVQTPIAERVRPYRLAARIGTLGVAAATHWRLRVRWRGRSQRGLGRDPTRPVAPLAGDRAAIDLKAPPTRESASIVQGDSRIWAHTDGQPFAVAVALPGQRTYNATAELAIMLCAVHGGAPDRLLVKLGCAGLDAAQSLLAEHAGAWGFPVEAVTEWRAASQRSAAADRHYHTHVFRAEAIGFVAIEFEASYHVREDYLALSAVFTWKAESRARNDVGKPA
jgi:hypothetical protein